ncbi:MAG: hypothetical protein AAFP04_07020 [Myxococcota bacterium]
MTLDITEFKRSRVYEVEQTIPETVDDIAELRLLDKRFEKVETIWGRVAAVLTVCTVLGFVGFVFAQQTVLGLVAAGLLVTSVIAWVMKAKWGRLNTEDRRYELLEELLKLLKVDMAETEEVRIRLDLSEPDASHKYQRKAKVGRWTVRYFVDPWLRLEGRLLDGTRFLVTMIAKTQQRTRTKRSRSGKTKHKRKTKFGAEALVTLKVKPARYRHLASLSEDAIGALQLTEDTERKQMTIDERGLGLRVKLSPSWRATLPDESSRAASGTHALAMMFLSLYQILNLSRAIEKKAGGAR